MNPLTANVPMCVYVKSLRIHGPPYPKVSSDSGLRETPRTLVLLPVEIKKME